MLLFKTLRVSYSVVRYEGTAEDRVCRTKFCLRPLFKTPCLKSPPLTAQRLRGGPTCTPNRLDSIRAFEGFNRCQIRTIVGEADMVRIPILGIQRPSTLTSFLSLLWSPSNSSRLAPLAFRPAAEFSSGMLPNNSHNSRTATVQWHPHPLRIHGTPSCPKHPSLLLLLTLTESTTNLPHIPCTREGFKCRVITAGARVGRREERTIFYHHVVLRLAPWLLS